MAEKKYDAGDIEILEGLEAVRVRPGMYIGSTGKTGLHHILWEIVDNAVDEAANGFADEITVKLLADGSASVEDNGRGIPTDIHPKMKISGVEVVFTQLHAGGKFDNHNYSFSGGLHGVGASVTNALSEWLKVEVYRSTIYKMEFHSYYDPETKKYHSGVPVAPLLNTRKRTTKRGTYVCFKPDPAVFETVKFDFEVVSKHLKEVAFLNKGLKIHLTDERGDAPVTVDYCYEGGIRDFVSDINTGKTVLFPTPIYCSGEADGIRVEFAIQYTDAYADTIISYVNNIPTPEGGMHEIGFKSGLTKALNDYARKEKFLKDKDENFLGDDFREGITAVLSIKMKSVQFEGQTKQKLGNPEARPAVEGFTVSALQNFSAERGSAATLEAIIKKAQGAAKARLAAKHAKELARSKNAIDSFNTLGKLAGCRSRKAADNELFIVEGDSAGGSAKQGRDSKYQAILPLRGKPLNVEKKRINQVIENEEFRTLISALGTGIGSDFTLKDLNFDKIIILSDADQDGAHIRAILLTFFFRYMKELITEGHVYIGMPPLYKVFKRDRVEYAYDDSELKSKCDLIGKGYQIQRYKGLGEMNPSQLWETTMDPKTRNLMQVTIEDGAEAERLITVLLGDNVDLRKKYITEHANFNKEDSFLKLKK